MGAKGTDTASEGDISALRERVESLEAQLRALVSTCEGLAWVKDASGRYVVVNEAVAEAAGLSCAEICGRTDLEIWPLEQAEGFRADDVAVMRSRVLKTVEGPIDAQRDGRSIWLTTRKVPVIAGDGGVLGTAGTARDITDERWTAIDREQARDELVHAQQRHIEELATPVLRLWKGVLAAPLIGRIDAWRAAQLMSALLIAIQREKARVVVIDITGVTQVDADVARRLLKTALAAGLVGARCMLVGIRAEVARTIVESGISIDDVQIYSTLEQALARIIDLEGAELDSSPF